MQTQFRAEYILLISFMIMTLMAIVKFMMIMACRQSEYFYTKLARSFFFYDARKINHTEEPRLKRYYKNSNRVNVMFYTCIAAGIAMYIGVHIVTLADYLQPGIASLLANR